MLRQGWHRQFLEPDLKMPLPRRVILDDKQKLFEMAERGGCKFDLEARQAINHAIEIGRGGVWLELTEEQYQRLRLGAGKLR